MSNGDDTQEMCCAAGICCGGDDDVKQIAAIVSQIRSHLGPGDGHSLEAIASVVNDLWDLTPKSWGVGTLLSHVAKIARTFPYV